jgi:predicted transcriptional regulator
MFKEHIVEITNPYPKEKATFVVRLTDEMSCEITDTARAVKQSKINLIRDAIADRLLYLRGYLNDKEDGHV